MRGAKEDLIREHSRPQQHGGRRREYPPNDRKLTVVVEVLV